ncbi:MAG: hypothetical protein RL660_121 [Bacteroidota bacterium]|jgi:uncharacterized membrane protein
MRKTARRLLTYFLQGVLVVAPVAITIYLVIWMFTSIDDLLPIFTRKDSIGRIVPNNRGLGVAIILAALTIIGYLSSNFITGRMFKFFDNMLERVPGIKVVYSTIRDFFEAFAGNKRKFTKPVLVLLRRDPELWQIGFITQEELSKITDQDLISVYMPHSYAVSGFTLLVRRDNVRPIEGIEPASAMKMAISGGVAGYDDEDELHEEEGEMPTIKRN